MGKGVRVGSKNSSQGHASKRNMKSDDSDEDYRLEEDELDDQTDELASLAGYASDEESLGGFADEEDEDEIVRNVVRSKSRKRSVRQMKKWINTSSKRRKRIPYGEEENDEGGGDEEDEDDYGNDCNSLNDEFNPDNLDFLVEEELSSSKVKKKKKGNPDDDEFNPDDLDFLDEEELPSSKGKNKKKGDPDDDEFYPDDQDFLDEEEELPSLKGKNKKRGNMDDDEFYLDDQDFLDEDEELTSLKGKNKKEGDTDDDEFNPDDEDEGEELPSSKWGNKKKGDTDDDEFNPDDQDFLDEEEKFPSSKGKNKKKGDTDDDEFNPDELDFLDEEEELPSPKGKNKKKGSMRGQKKRTGWKLLKKPQKKKRNGSSKSTKSTSGKSRKSKNNVPSSRGICKRMPTCRKKAMLSSDSDFVSSESTDREFTISEEEREQVREATEICRRETSNLRSTKRDQEDAAYNQLRNLPRRKGKEKVQEVKNDIAKEDCGICLTKEGKNTIRGTLNCCNHFFCFACIIEWSKVETRCPLCKQRFITISKPTGRATRIDLRDVVIEVPERDQVYQPTEEELRDYLDPYENVICTECHEGGDDALMLLCDLCDSPAHTYCVGLGREVPEGNWYCEGCKPSALGFTSSHVQDHRPIQRPINSALNEPYTFDNMAEIDLNITIPETPMNPGTGILVSPRQQPSGGGGLQQAPPPVSGVGVSTLSGRRRVRRLQYYLSNNRFSHMGTRVDPATQSPFLETGATDLGTLYHAEYTDRLQENSFSSLTRENFPGRQNIVRGQSLQIPSAADGTNYGYVHLGQVGGMNLGLNSVSGCEWLQPCTSRLNLGSGTSMSPLYNGDVDQNAAKQLQ